MIYVAYYSRPAKPFCVKIITRGFACTRQELPREIQTRCGRDAKLISYEMYGSAETARTIIDHCKPEWKEEAC